MNTDNNNNNNNKKKKKKKKNILYFTAKVHIKYYMGLLKQTSESVKLTKRAKINFLCLSIVNS